MTKCYYRDNSQFNTHECVITKDYHNGKYLVSHTDGTVGQIIPAAHLYPTEAELPTINQTKQQRGWTK
jgi:hypothetical protein